MNTTFILLAKHETPLIKLEDICEDYFGLSKGEARKRANLNTLPIPTVRMADSNKSPILVHVDDLAKHIDEQRRRATEQWARSQI
ncbi:pyocin activator PrtN family protein [Laribacter hongkongensis]|uniref:pyocin activator PrtN family protein n=1 Tax=Laribacter hongkongensis TaxID=168471 RepID=UPI001EFE4E33|nr:pyocin activator PrtN family protein [Laribacter hongkongensis]MCG8991781.1 pyocin activator PrtN family protein [Laribacter hongkongensis]MCG8998706.1 pyocin activator PrtN family protein [Laribacter hongkongensis]MCG9000220.1 pyocin activator PrtN family protein [Laribacter hongkongensis]MCG9004423.1 pyocin activator PrtN family protein [Laribacter hongkongensis]MCG9006610.1 pyocin activator PrtN family protein [Laribacter hongkongensis]